MGCCSIIVSGSYVQQQRVARVALGSRDEGMVVAEEGYIQHNRGVNTESKVSERSSKVPYRTLQKRQIKQNTYNLIGIARHARTQMASRYSRYLAAHNFCVFQECMIAKIHWFPVPCLKSTSGRQNDLASWDKFGNKPLVVVCCHQ